MTSLPDCVCPKDGTRVPGGTLAWCCPVCEGPLDLDFHPTPGDLKTLGSRVNSLWRYGSSLPLANPSVSLGEGRTPLVALTGQVSAKLDFLMPTLSFKDRGAVMLAELASRLGPEQVIADSSGNAGRAVAAYCARAALPCTVYVPAGTAAKKLTAIRQFGAQVEEVPGDREATARAARAAANAPGTFYASHVHNPYFLHGTKTYVFEIWEDLGGRLPDALVVPVGNGTLLLGAALALRELHTAGLIDRLPALYAVQAEAVAPLARAWAAGSPDLTDPAPLRDTAAAGIAIPHPPRARQILSAVREFGGGFLTVPEPDLDAARRDLARRGLAVEPTAVACWAAVRTGVLGSRSVVLPLCGAG
ncbi:pyridoxal-phosphate dependent enzyme [Streptomyces sp. YC504]|uniref:Pyridoxal-phosphate dependent enzyme n=1 Tax=Streptomyces mesophilus TaxID=1775132 RepID=A0A6G4XFP7_9ACTN|nr:pyridoxal-phosphate dependent enzyme [Streptomyces mesophilus]NGO75657.1 pyridoxal-phosphate dependent enzyme [Streptomyces mesophilus]